MVAHALLFFRRVRAPPGKPPGRDFEKADTIAITENLFPVNGNGKWGILVAAKSDMGPKRGDAAKMDFRIYFDRACSTGRFNSKDRGGGGG